MVLIHLRENRQEFITLIKLKAKLLNLLKKTTAAFFAI